jgi:hypothetical protein
MPFPALRLPTHQGEEPPGVNCQESTHEELLNSLRATLREALELNKEDALAAAGADFQEEPIAI